MSFQKFSVGDTPDTHSGRRRPPPAPNTQPGLWPGAGRKRPGVGTQTLVPLNFSAVVGQEPESDCATVAPLLCSLHVDDVHEVVLMSVI